MREGWLIINGQVAASLVVPRARLVRFRTHVAPAAASCFLSRRSIVLGGVRLVSRRDGAVRRMSSNRYVHVAPRGAVLVAPDVARQIRKGDVMEVRMAE